ncbi:MAG TPA: hypothetical protein VF746_08800 [Longimicrobium sp.]|jgi:tetratricopeptide (TPR) repeat protein
MTREPAGPRRGPPALEFFDRTVLPTAEPGGEPILREVDPACAVPLFEVYRTVLLFAGHPPGESWPLTEQLRAREEEVLRSALEPALRDPLAVILGQIADPARTDPGKLAWACLHVTDWALAHDAPDTALVFAEAAALCAPASGRWALVAGRTYKTHGRMRDAVLWLRRARIVSRRQHDWESLVLSLNSLGMVFWQQGAIPKAWTTLRQARRVASRHKLRTLEGEALHNLFVLAVTTEQMEIAEEYARGAAERFLPHHHRLPALAYDLAYYWLSRGYPRRALPVFQRLVPHFPQPAQRIQVLSATARAAGAADDRVAFEGAWQDAFTLLASSPVRTTLAAALLDLGLGAAHLGEWQRAEDAFCEAIQASREYGQADIQVRAEDYLSAARSRRNADNIIRPAALAVSQQPAEQLAQRFVVALTELARKQS